MEQLDRETGKDSGTERVHTLAGYRDRDEDFRHGPNNYKDTKP